MKIKLADQYETDNRYKNKTNKVIRHQIILTCYYDAHEAIPPDYYNNIYSIVTDSDYLITEERKEMIFPIEE